MFSSRTRLAPLSGAAVFLFFAFPSALLAQTAERATTAPAVQAAPAATAGIGSAWTDRVFLNVSFGQQWMNQQFRTEGSIANVYDETATWEAPFDVDDSQLFDISGGYRIWKNLAIGAGLTRTSDSHAASFTASIPDLLEFDRPHVTTQTIDGLDREEQIVHISAIWMVPILDRVDVALSAGPSFFTVTQSYVSGMTVTPGQSTVGSVATASVEKSATGYHVAADTTVRIIRNVGAGFLVRYAAAKIVAPELQGDNFDAGGFQALAGLRIRF
jgi:hypothetical protein